MSANIATPNSPAGAGSSPSPLLVLERAYDAFKACEKRAIWGGSCEIEMAAQQDLRAHGRTMFAALEAFMTEHKANDKDQAQNGRD